MKLGIVTTIGGDDKKLENNNAINAQLKGLISTLYEEAVNTNPAEEAPRISSKKKNNINLYKELLEILRVIIF